MRKDEYFSNASLWLHFTAHWSLMRCTWYDQAVKASRSWMRKLFRPIASIASSLTSAFRCASSLPFKPCDSSFHAERHILLSAAFDRLPRSSAYLLSLASWWASSCCACRSSFSIWWCFSEVYRLWAASHRAWFFHPWNVEWATPRFSPSAKRSTAAFTALRFLSFEAVLSFVRFQLSKMVAFMPFVSPCRHFFSIISEAAWALALSEAAMSSASLILLAWLRSVSSRKPCQCWASCSIRSSISRACFSDLVRAAQFRKLRCLEAFLSPSNNRSSRECTACRLRPSRRASLAKMPQ
mmetsp:Transcript_69534/g.215108  ORF Transcript_69534/g.215108 Transcript_69534/m.215108 type:complete len:296 (+) Transcript_69534:461-1348(+)